MLQLFKSFYRFFISDKKLEKYLELEYRKNYFKKTEEDFSIN
jgi:hypothetical protein